VSISQRDQTQSVETARRHAIETHQKAFCAVQLMEKRMGIVVRWGPESLESDDHVHIAFLSLFHHSPYFSSFHYFSSFYYFDSDFWYIDMHPTLAGFYPFLLGFPARCTFLSYLCLYICLGSPDRSRLSYPQLP